MKSAQATRARPAGYINDSSGAAAVETALTLGLLLIPMMGLFDIGLYAFDRMQVENAAQMAVQSAFNACSQGVAAPLLTNCTNLSGAVTSGAQSTSLGANVSVTSTTEGDYCVGGAGALTTTGCGTTAHYLRVDVSYTYTPLFSAVSVANVLGTSIVRSHYMRMS